MTTRQLCTGFLTLMTLTVLAARFISLFLFNLDSPYPGAIAGVIAWGLWVLHAGAVRVEVAMDEACGDAMTRRLRKEGLA